MNKHRISCSHRHHIDNGISSDCSQNSHLIGQDQPDNSHRNNHNSNFIQPDELVKSTSGINLRKRRTNLPYRQRSEQSLLSSTHLIIIRSIILLIMCFLFYYISISIYTKPKRTGWKRIWHVIIDWLIGE